MTLIRRAFAAGIGASAAKPLEYVIDPQLGGLLA
jgi:hypothetical protein